MTLKTCFILNVAISYLLNYFYQSQAHENYAFITYFDLCVGYVIDWSILLCIDVIFFGGEEEYVNRVLFCSKLLNFIAFFLFTEKNH